MAQLLTLGKRVHKKAEALVFIGQEVINPPKRGKCSVLGKDP